MVLVFCGIIDRMRSDVGVVVRHVDANVVRANACRRLRDAGCFHGRAMDADSVDSASAVEFIADAFRATPGRGDARASRGEAEISASIVMRFSFAYWRERARVRRVIGDADDG